MRCVLLLLLCTAVTVQASYAEGEDTAELSVMTWNILAPMWVDRQQFEDSGKVDINLLDNDIRLQLVVDRIIESRSDIVNLQEVQEDTFPTIRDKLAKYYTPVAFAPNVDNYWKEYLPEGVKYVKNGVATFYRKSKLLLRSEGDVYVIPTSDQGSIALLTVLWPLQRTFLGPGRRSTGHPIININSHLETGVTAPEARLRVIQATTIATSIGQIRTALKSAFPAKEPVTIWSGDFNSMNGFPTMQAINAMGFSSAMEALGVNSPTHYGLEPVTLPGNITAIGFVIDHVLVSAADVAAGLISLVSAEVPDIFTAKFSEEGHTATLVALLSDQMRGERLRGRSDVINYLLSSELFSKLYTSRSDGENYDEYEAVRALRLGSDHLPVEVVARIKF